MPGWLSIVLALGGSALISAIIGIVCKRIETAADKKKARNDAYKEEHEERETEERFNQFKKDLVSEMKEIVKPINEKLDVVSTKLDEDRTATITTMRSKMKTLRDQYKEQGFADASDKATWNELYNNYKKMGGNHFKEYVNQWKAEVEALPLEAPKNKKESTKKYVHD